MSNQSKTLASLVSAAFVAGAFGVATAHADVNPFSAVSVGQAVQLAGMEGSCGEGKCGENMDSEEMDSEGSCGEGNCGENMEGEAKDGEGKCGEGKCGSK